MNLQTLVMTLCLICSPAISATAPQECFSNLHQLRLVHKTEDAKYRLTPYGKCWHTGEISREQAKLAMKRLQPKIKYIALPPQYDPRVVKSFEGNYDKFWSEIYRDMVKPVDKTQYMWELQRW